MSVASCFPLAARVQLWLYVTALLAMAAFAVTESNFTPVVVGVIVALIAWLLVDSPDGFLPATLVPRRTPTETRGATGGAFHWWVVHARTIVLNLVMLAAGVYFWYEGQGQAERDHPGVIVALVHFIEVLLLCKFFESKSPRNGVQILALSLLLTVSATMLSNSGLYFFAILVVYFASLFYAVMGLNLAVETDRFGTGTLPDLVPAQGATRGVSGRSGPWRLMRRDLGDTAKQCFVLIIPVVLALFLLLPRHRTNPMPTSWDLGSYQTGFSETVQLRDFGRLEPSDDEVMRVTLRRGNEDVSFEFSDLYLRGQVLDQYSGSGLWSHAPLFAETDTATEPGTAGLSAAEGALLETAPIQVTYDLKFARGGWLPIVAPCIPPADERFTYGRDDMTCRLGGNWSRGMRPIKYTLAWAKELAPLAQGKSRCTPGVLATVVTLMPDGTVTQKPTVRVSPQIEELARRLVGPAIPGDGPMDPGQMRSVMTIFESYLRSNYAYSLTFLRVDKSLERTTDFLLNRKATGGNCEYFASSMVMLCRAVGLNARMVVGYHTGEYYPSSPGYFLVRQKHAHSWAEVYIPGAGWVMSDPTPGGSAAGAELAGNWFQDLKRVVQGTWITSVVSFDNDTRAALANWFSARIDRLLDLQPLSAGRMVALSGAALILFAIFLRLRRHFRRLQPLLASTRGIPHRQARLSVHVSFLDDLLHLFDHAAERRPDLTPLEFLEPHFGRLGPAVSEKVRWLVVTAYGVRFGGLHVDANLNREIVLALRSVKAAVRSRPQGMPIS